MEYDCIYCDHKNKTDALIITTCQGCKKRIYIKKIKNIIKSQEESVYNIKHYQDKLHNNLRNIVFYARMQLI
jgi:hypothetical protein